MKKLFSIIAITAITFSSLSALVLPEGTDARITDIKLTKGKITKVALKEETDINCSLGMVKAFGDVLFYENGSVKSFTPAEGGTFITPSGTVKYTSQLEKEEPAEIEFYESGCLKSIKISEETVVKTKRGNLTAKPGYVKFYDNWTVQELTPKNNSSIKISAGVVSILNKGPIIFYESGRIKQFTTADDYSFNTQFGAISPKNRSEITLFENGNLAEISVDEIFILSYDNNTLYTKPESTISFYANGQLKSISVLNNELALGGCTIAFAKDSIDLKFYEDGAFTIPETENTMVYNCDTEFQPCSFVYYNPKHKGNIYTFNIHLVEKFYGYGLNGNHKVEIEDISEIIGTVNKYYSEDGNIKCSLAAELFGGDDIAKLYEKEPIVLNAAGDITKIMECTVLFNCDNSDPLSSYSTYTVTKGYGEYKYSKFPYVYKNTDTWLIKSNSMDLGSGQVMFHNPNMFQAK